MTEQQNNEVDPALWDQLMVENDAAYAQAEVRTGGWVPGPGKYRVLITEVRTGAYTPKDGNGKSLPYWAPKGQILGVLGDTSDLDDVGKSIIERTFDVGFLSMGNPIRDGIFKKWAQVLADGDTVNDLRVADSLLRSAPGTVVDVQVIVKGGYTNVYLLDKVPLKDPQPAASPAQPASA